MNMLKQVLAFCALMLISLSVVLAEKDTWIDGITLRAAKSSYKLKIVKLADLYIYIYIYP